jgi:ABC-type multidrug transport system ATPase subunit
VLLATVRPAELIIVDDVDRNLDPEQQARLWAVLDALTEDHLTVVASTVHPETVPARAQMITLSPAAHPTRS